MRIDTLVMTPSTGDTECVLSGNILKRLVQTLFSGARTSSVATPGEGTALESAGMLLRSATYNSARRNLVFALTTDTALLASAPSAVQTLAATLAADTEQTAKSSFVAHVQGGQLWFVARRAEALELAAYYLVRQHGGRYLAPNESWHIAPDFTSNPATESRIVTPSVALYSWAGTGGLNTTPGLDGQAEANQAIADWFLQLICPRGAYWSAGTDNDEGLTINRFYEYNHRQSQLAWVIANAQRGYSSSGAWPATVGAAVNSLAKLCYTDHGDSGQSYPSAPAGPAPWAGVTLTPSNSALAVDPLDPGTATPYNAGEYSSWSGGVRLGGEFLWQVVALEIQQNGADCHEAVTSEANDGSYFCECTNCRDLLRNGPYAAYLTPTEETQDATDADKIWHGAANERTKYLDHQLTNAPEGFVFFNSISIYATHASVPSIPIFVGDKAKIFARHLTSSTGYWGNGPDQSVTAWAFKRANNPLGVFEIGVHPAWSITVGFWDGPFTTDRDVKRLVQQCLDGGYDAFTAQTTHGFMPMAPLWYALSRWFWGEDFDTALEEWFTASCGSGAVRTTVRAMYSRWWAASLDGDGIDVDIRANFTWQRQELAFTFADILTAQTQLDAAPDADVQLRLDHLKAYCQHLRLYTEYIPTERAYLAAPGPGALRVAYLAALAALQAWNYGLYSTNILHHARLSEKWYLAQAGADAAEAAYWSYLSSGGPGAVAQVLPTSGQLQTICEDGAADYPPISGVVHTVFSDALVPLTSSVDATTVTGKWHAAGVHYYRIQKPAGDVAITVTTQHQSTNTQPTIFRVYSLDGETLHQENRLSQSPTWGINVNHAVTLTGYGAGSYVIQVTELNTAGFSRLLTPRSLPCSYIGQWQWQGVDVANPQYFFVPAGLTRIALAFDSNTVIPLQFYDNTGAARTTTHYNPNLWVADVPAGQDNKYWSMTHAHPRDANAKVRFINCPNVIAYHPDQLMVPSEVL